MQSKSNNHTQLLTLTRLRIRRKKGVLYTIGQKHDNLLDKKRSYFPVLNSLVIRRKEEKRIIGCLTPFDLINLLLYFQTFKIIKLQHNEKIISDFYYISRYIVDRCYLEQSTSGSWLWNSVL